MRRFAVLAALGLVAAACSGDMPTGPDSMLGPQDALMKNGATGAVVGVPEDFDFSAIDEAGNGDGTVCVKTVPEGKGQGAARTIAKDNKNDMCPGGFEEVSLGLPACTYNGQDASTCDCDAAGGNVIPGYNVCVGIVGGG